MAGLLWQGCVALWRACWPAGAAADGWCRHDTIVAVELGQPLLKHALSFYHAQPRKDSFLDISARLAGCFANTYRVPNCADATICQCHWHTGDQAKRGPGEGGTAQCGDWS